MRIIPLGFTYEIGVAWPTTQYEDKKTRAFREIARELYGDLPPNEERRATA